MLLLCVPVLTLTGASASGGGRASARTELSQLSRSCAAEGYDMCSDPDPDPDMGDVHPPSRESSSACNCICLSESDGDNGVVTAPLAPPGPIPVLLLRLKGEVE